LISARKTSCKLPKYTFQN